MEIEVREPAVKHTVTYWRSFSDGRTEPPIAVERIRRQQMRQWLSGGVSRNGDHDR